MIFGYCSCSVKLRKNISQDKCGTLQDILTDRRLIRNAAYFIWNDGNNNDFIYYTSCPENWKGEERENKIVKKIQKTLKYMEKVHKNTRLQRNVTKRNVCNNSKKKQNIRRKIVNNVHGWLKVCYNGKIITYKRWLHD